MDKSQITPKYITKEGLRKLREELDYRMTTLRKEIADKLDSAKSMGDLSENSAYHAALEEYQHNEVRIKDLKTQIPSLIIAENKGGDDTVDIGDTIEVEDLSSGRKIKYSIVGEGEGNPVMGQLSVNSAIGKALFGKKVGTTVKVELPTGTKEIIFVSVT